MDSYEARKQDARTFDHYMREKSKDCYYSIPRLPAWIETRVAWPFGLLAARVRFFDRNDESNYVSTYLDVDDQAGYMEKPYFEIYPGKDGDTERFYLDEQDEMIKAVIRSLKSNRRRKAASTNPRTG